MKNVSPYQKALVSFVGAAIIAYLGATDGGVTRDEWLKVLAAGVAAGVAVLLVPNKPKATDEGGYAAFDLVGVAILIGVVLLLFGVHFR